MRRFVRLGRGLRVALVAVLLAVTGLTVLRAVEAVTATPPEGDTRPVVAFIGDAYTAGSGATTASARWTSIVAREEHWRSFDFGRPNTGFASSSSAKVCGFALCPPFEDWVDAVAAVDPDVVVIAGGQDDWLAWEADSERTQALIDSTLDTFQERIPRARIVVVSPLQPPGAEHAGTVASIAEAVQESAEARGLPFVDLLDPNVLSSGADLAADRFNASDLGHRAIADRVLQALE